MIPPPTPISILHQQQRLAYTRKVRVRESMVSWLLTACTFASIGAMIVRPGMIPGVLIAGFLFATACSRNRVHSLKREERHIQRLILRRKQELCSAETN